MTIQINRLSVNPDVILSQLNDHAWFGAPDVGGGIREGLREMGSEIDRVFPRDGNGLLHQFAEGEVHRVGIVVLSSPRDRSEKKQEGKGWAFFIFSIISSTSS
jgi:hypothetical protein